MKKLPLRMRWPHPAVKIRMRDLGPETETVDYGPPGPCPFCPDSLGLITRESHPWSLRWNEVPLVVYAYEDPLCRGTGIYQARFSRPIPRPRCWLKNRKESA